MNNTYNTACLKRVHWLNICVPVPSCFQLWLAQTPNSKFQTPNQQAKCVSFVFLVHSLVPCCNDSCQLAIFHDQLTFHILHPICSAYTERDDPQLCLNTESISYCMLLYLKQSSSIEIVSNIKYLTYCN